jgi:indole-3-glycerol phosphate synthase
MQVKEINRNLKNLNPNSVNFLDILAANAYISIAEGYYDINTKIEASTHDLNQSIRRSSKNAIISEIKFASPSQGIIHTEENVVSAAKAMSNGGAVGLSVLTEPKTFLGSLDNFMKVREVVDLPLLMKDIIVTKKQLDAALKIGADVILLIQTLFDMGRCKNTVEQMIEYAHSKDLQVLLEIHSKEEFEKAIQSNADLIGINNRNLETFEVDLSTTKTILESKDKGNKIIVSESGINTAKDVCILKKSGADAFLVGTSVMKSKDIASKVKELAET